MSEYFEIRDKLTCNFLNVTSFIDRFQNNDTLKGSYNAIFVGQCMKV